MTDTISKAVLQGNSEPIVSEVNHDDGSAATSSVPIVKPPRTLTSFVPILEQMQGSFMLEDDEYHIAGHPTASEWTKLQAYTSTVEELLISDSDPKAAKIADVIYFLLGQLQGPASPLFPSLSRLRIASTTPTSLPYLFLSFSPSLKELELIGLTDNARATLAAFLQRAGKEASLTTLILDPINLVPEVVRLIAKCNSLENLELRNVTARWDASSLSTLAGLPRLKNLKVNATKIEGSYLGTGGPKRLSSLTDLHFTGAVSTLNEIMSDCKKMTSLLTLHLRLGNYQHELDSKGLPGPHRLREAFRRIASINNSEAANNLTSLTIMFTNDKNGTARDTRLHTDYLAVFSTLKNLEHLEIMGIEIYQVERVADFCQHWPKMRTLLLPATNGDSIPLSSVLALTRSCPDLTSLQVPIQIPQNVLPITPKDVFSHQLASLSVGSPANSDLGNPADRMLRLTYVARSLSATFSSLKITRTHQGHQEQFWDEVGQLMKLCKDVVDFSRQRDATSSLQDGV